jgi:hypothetical protein
MYKAEIIDPAEGQLPSDLNKIFIYWQNLCGNEYGLPWSEFDWMKIPPIVISMCTVVDVMENPLDFVYRFWGTGRTNIQGYDLTGRSVKDVQPESLGIKAFDEYSLVCESRKPIYVRTVSTDTDNDKPVMYHFLRLPFFSESEQVNNIMTASQRDWMDIKRVHHIY